MAIRNLRLFVLFLAFSFGVITSGLGINAIVKSNQEKASLKSAAPPPTIVHIDTNDIFSAGVSATVAAGLAAIDISILVMQPLLFPKLFSSARFSRLQPILLAFLATWTFASLIVFTDFFVTRSAQVTASLGGVQLPAQVIQQVEKSLGATPLYRKKHYLALFAVIPWVSGLFTALAAIVCSCDDEPTKCMDNENQHHHSPSTDAGHSLVTEKDSNGVSK